MVVFIEALEDKNADVRCVACMAFKLLKVSGTVKVISLYFIANYF